jgi:chromosome segregation ATPase
VVLSKHHEPSFLQVQRRRPRRTEEAEDGGSALLATADLQLGALAANGQKEDFTAAKKVVTDLIAVLEKQQQDEESKVKYCKAELASKESEKASVEDEISTITAKIEYQQATRSTLENEVEDLNKVVEEQKEELKKAKVIREDEKKAYETGKKDRELAVKVLNQAKQVLKGFYETPDSTSLAQHRSTGRGAAGRRHQEKRVAQGPNDVAGAGAQPETWTGSSRKDVQGFNIVQVMDMLIGDISKEEKDASLQEADAAAQFEKLEKDTQDNFDSMMQETTDRVKQKAKLVVTLNIAKESKTEKTNDLAAVNAQIESLHQECDDLLQHFEERTKARTFELSQLRDVVDILSGSSVAARTGGGAALLEQPDSLSDREKMLLQDMSRAATGLASRTRSGHSDN